ncbi:armadillo-type protein [Mycena rebaudengoi]|nr:armadillo-type protein [Mycena rebaudengoi]
MKLMYDWEARRFMKKDRRIPLSKTSIEIYLSYLEYKYVGASTKTKVLEYIAKKDISDDDAHQVANSVLLESTAIEAADTQMQIYACDMLVNLTVNTSSAPVVLQLNPCGRLVFLLRANNPTVTVRALKALDWIAGRPNGGPAVIEAGTLHLVDYLFGSSNTEVRTGTCDVLSSLASEESTSNSVILANPFGALVSLLRDTEVVANATNTLGWIANSAEGAQGVIEARMLDVFDEVLKLPDQSIACWLIENLVSHESTADSVFASIPCQHIVALLLAALNRDDDTVWDALPALATTAHSVEGAIAVVEAGTLLVLDKHLESADYEVREWACRLIGYLAIYYKGQEDLCEKLVLLLRDDAGIVASAAMFALSKIASLPSGATTVVEAGLLDLVDEILESQVSLICTWTCAMLQNLAKNESTAIAVVVLNPCRRLVALLRHSETGVVASALCALGHIALQTDGALAVAETGVSQAIDQLLESFDSGFRTAAAWLENRGHRLVKLSCDDSPAVAESAVYALSRIAYWPDGGDAVVQAGALQLLENLVPSSNAGVRQWTCAMLENLTSHQSTSAALLEINPCERLVKLLTSKDPGIISAAASCLH